MATPSKVQFTSFRLSIAGELYEPAAGATDRKGAAIVISHPMTGVKEQTVADYARAVSAQGFYALTFDAAYQGESSGEPRGLEDPHQRVEDIKSAVTYLTTLKDKVDPERIGLLGICASGGYASYATQSDARIKALATVSAVCIGRMMRSGGVHSHLSENAEAIAGALKGAAEWRKAQAASSTWLEAPVMFDADPSKVTPDTDKFAKCACDYYGTKRGKHERSTQRIPPSSYDLMISYDSFNFQYLISPRPLLMIAGSEAESAHFSKTALEIAKEPKESYIVNNKNHTDLYDELRETGPKVVDFFGSHL